MKQLFKIIKSIMKWFSIILLGFIIIIIILWTIQNKIYSKKATSSLIGTFVLDLERTDLGMYSDSIDDYKDLTIEFKKDKTFKFNKSVPFIADTIGTWEARGAGVEKWNYIYYDNWKAKYAKGITGDQFSFIDEGDFVFYINSIIPRADQLRKSDVRVVYFKKINISSK